MRVFLGILFFQVFYPFLWDMFLVMKGGFGTWFVPIYAPLVNCLLRGLLFLHNKEIEFLSRLCLVQILILGDLIIGISKCFATLVDRINRFSNFETKFINIVLFICVAKEHLQMSMAVFYEARSTFDFI